jgi:uncharacterized protein (TIGR02001 family)
MNRLAAVGCLPLFACAAAAAAADASLSGNVTIVSDYDFRGVTQTQGKPALQGNLDWTHASGAYLGMFGSNVSWAAYNNGARTEIDLYGGYRHALSDDSNIDTGLISYWYPGARYQAAGNHIVYNTQDLKLGLNLGSFNAYGWLTVSRHFFGFAIDPANSRYADSRGTTYVEANWNPELASGLVANLHAGRQDIRHFSALNFYDFKLGLTQTWGGWALSVAGTYNSGDAWKNGLPYWTFFNADGTSQNVAGTRWLLSAARNF